MNASPPVYTPEYNITLDKAKCIFGVDKVTLMAMELSSKGMQPSQQKVDAVKFFKTPANVSEVMSFLGLITFRARFVPNLDTKAEPLRRLTRAGTKWVWGPLRVKRKHLKRLVSGLLQQRPEIRAPGRCLACRIRSCPLSNSGRWEFAPRSMRKPFAD